METVGLPADFTSFCRSKNDSMEERGRPVSLVKRYYISILREDLPADAAPHWSGLRVSKTVKGAGIAWPGTHAELRG